MDTDPVMLNSVIVHGTLQFSGDRDILFQSESIMVAKGGRIEAGTLESPFHGKLNITLLGM